MRDKQYVKSWWKIPLFCIIAGWICFELEVRFLGRFAIVTLPDGTITSNNTYWMIMSAILFAITLIVGGVMFFRKMTRKELLFSASVMFVFGMVCGVITQLSNIFPIMVFYSKIYTWCDITSQILLRLNINNWVSAAILWAVPFLFVLFGKKSFSQGTVEEISRNG